MPTIIERNGRFLARVRKDGFKPVAKTFGRKSDAKAWGLRIEADMAAGRYVEAAAVVPTLREAIQDYRAEVADALKGAEFYRFTFEQLCSEPFTAKRLDEVTASDVSGWRDSMAARGLAAGTVVRRLGLLGGLFTWAQKDRRWIDENPLRHVRKPRVNDARDRVLSDEERRWLLAGAGSGRNAWLADVLVVLLQSAMRRSEVWGLTVDDVDVGACVARLADTKNGTPRQVPLCPAALSALVALSNRAQAAAAIARSRGQAAPARGAERLVPVGDAPAVSLAFRRALARGLALYRADCAGRGVDADAGFLVGVRLHDLRHTSVTAWASTGELSVHELQAVSGHKTLSMLSRYVNLDRSALAAKLARVNGGAVVS